MKKKRISKVLRVLSAALICFTVAVSGVSAGAEDDLLNAPQNSFYEAYESECELHDFRSFTAVNDFEVYVSPVDMQSVRRVGRGEVVSTNVSYVSPDGVIWGYAYSETSPEGWFRMENVQIIYDSISFTEEHINELVPYSGQLDGFTPNQYLYFWKYPHSGEIETVCQKGDDWFESGDVLNLGERALYVYKDGSGSEWVYIDFLPGGWVYAANPETDLRLNSNQQNQGEEGEGDTLYEDVEAGANVVVYGDVVFDPYPGLGDAIKHRLPVIILLPAAIIATAVLVRKKKNK